MGGAHRAGGGVKGSLRDRDMRCHACGYNLRGAERIACPECGVVIARPVLEGESPREPLAGAERAWRRVGWALVILQFFGAWGVVSHIWRASKPGGTWADPVMWLSGALYLTPLGALLAWRLRRSLIDDRPWRVWYRGTLLTGGVFVALVVASAV